MKKIAWIIIGALLSAAPLAAQEVRLADVEGKVEIKAPGGDWEPAEEGRSLSMRTMISTGFNSRAVLEIGSATTTVQPLTRLEIQDVQLDDREQRTALFLGAGRIRAEVRRGQDLSVDFSVRTPVATAAVRGTDFEVSTTALTVRDGVVRFDSGGYYVVVQQGGSSAVLSGVPGVPLVDPFDAATGDRTASADFSDYTGNRRSRGAAGDRTGQPVIRIR